MTNLRNFAFATCNWSLFHTPTEAETYEGQQMIYTFTDHCEPAHPGT